MARVFKEYLEWTVGKLAPDGRPFPERWGFRCPGCREALLASDLTLEPEDLDHLCTHVVNVRDVHAFNGNPDRPTFSPSIMAPVASGHICHSYVTDGRIQYLGDSTHPLSGSTVDLPEIEVDADPA